MTGVPGQRRRPRVVDVVTRGVTLTVTAHSLRLATVGAVDRVLAVLALDDGYRVIVERDRAEPTIVARFHRLPSDEAITWGVDPGTGEATLTYVLAVDRGRDVAHPARCTLRVTPAVEARHAA